MLRARLPAFLALVLMSASAAAEPRGTTPAGGACASDNDCVNRTICTENTCTPLPKRRWVVPFYFHQPGEVGHRHITPILYFSTWDKEGVTRAQFPFFGYRKDYANNSATTVLPLFAFWYTAYKGEGEQVGAMPFFFWKRRGLSRTLALPLLLSGGSRDAEKDITEAVVGLIGYYRRHHDDTWRVLFPLFWDHQSSDRRTTVVPPLGFWRRTPEKTSGVIFPLVWHFADHVKGRQNLVVLPLFEYETSDHGKKSRMVSLIAAWERNDHAKLKQLLLYAPLVFHRQDAHRDVTVVPPVFTYWKVHDDGSTGLIAGPIFHAGDSRGSTTSLLPLYWRFYDKRAQAETQLLFPIAGFHRHPGAAGAFVGPVYGWRSKNDLGGWGAGLAPLFFFGRTGTKRHALALPLFLHWSDAKDRTSTTVVGPVFHHAAKNGSGWDAGLFPILFFGKRTSTTYATVPPLFYHRSTPEGTTSVVGPAYVLQGKRGWAFGLAPLLFFGKRDGVEHQVIFPLFFRFADPEHRKERMLVGPYFHRRDGDVTTDVLFPIFYLKRGAGRALLLSPLGGWKKDPVKETVVVGLYGYQRDKKKRSTTHLLFPFGVVHNAPSYQVMVQFPFFWRVKEGQETDTTIFPIYWRSRAPGKAIDLVFPIVFHARTPVATTTIVGPLWNRARKDGGRSLGVFPVFAYGKIVKNGKSSSYFGIPGVYWDKNEHAGTSHFVAGPFFRNTRPDGYTGGLIPLAFAWKRGTASKVLTPIFYRQADSAAGYDLNVLGPFYWSKRPNDRRFGIVPLLFTKWRPDGTGYGMIFPLFYYEKKQLGSVFATFLFGYSKYPTGVRAYFGPIYVRRDSLVSTTAIFPLVYFTKDHVTGTSTKMALPFLLDTRTEDGRELGMYTPLIWRYRSVERSIIVGLPLFFDVHSYKESRTTGLLPLFVRNKSQVYDSTSWVFPPLLSWGRERRGPNGGTDYVIFPLIWRFGGKKDNTTVVLPLYWDFKRGEARTTVMFPIMARWKRHDGVHTIVANMYYRKGLGPKEGSWWCDVFPLASFGRPRKGDLEWNILEGLIGYARQGRNRTLRILWLFDIALQPVPASNLTWWSSTPSSARTDLF